MRSLVFALLVMLLPAVASAQAAGPNTDVQNTIAAQIEAFAAEDVEQAFSFASPFIQRQFGNPENFGAMVRSGYPMVWAPAEVYYHEQAEQGGATWQQVQFVDAAGDEYWFAYEMIVIDGEWRINGVYPMQQPDMSV